MKFKELFNVLNKYGRYTTNELNVYNLTKKSFIVMELNSEKPELIQQWCNDIADTEVISIFPADHSVLNVYLK